MFPDRRSRSFLDPAVLSRLAGFPLTRAYASVWTLEDGKIRRHDEYTDHAEALEAVALRE